MWRIGNGRPPLARSRLRLKIALPTALLFSTATVAEGGSPTLLDIVQVGDIASLSLSPDGERAAFRVQRASHDRNSYDLKWYVFELRSRSVVEAGGGGEPILDDPGIVVAEPPIWSRDGRWFYHRALRDRAVQIWRSAGDGSGSQIVTGEEGDVMSLERSSGGAALHYRVGPSRASIEQAEVAEYDSGILINEHVELGQNLFRGQIIHGRPASQRLTGRWFERGGLLSADAPRVRSLDPATLVARDLGPGLERKNGSSLGDPAMVELARSGAGDTISSKWDGGEGVLQVVKAGPGSRPLVCGAAQCRWQRIDWAAWHPSLKRVVFATADPAQVQTLHLWDLDSNRVRTIVRAEGLLNGGRKTSAPCAISASTALCVAASAASPPRLESVDLGAGRRTVIFDPNSLLRAKHWPAVQQLAWRSEEGRHFTGTLFLPRTAAAKPLPLFINYYRCPGFLRGAEGDEWPLAVLAASGIAAACVNATRMAGPQDGIGQYQAALGGVEALIDLLAERGIADRKKVGMGGISFGSEVAMWIAMRSDLLAAMSLGSPQLDPVSYWFNTVRGRDHAKVLKEVWGLGAPDLTESRWRLVSPALNVSRVRAPVLLQLAEQEARYAIEFYSRLTNTATPTEMYVFPDERHFKVQPRHRLAVYQRNLDWFRYWLQGHVEDDPARSKQYARWLDLRTRWQDQTLRDRSQSSMEARSNILK